MAVSSIKAIFNADIQKVWDTVTSLHNYSWRSDLSKIEVMNEKQFIEYTNAGFATSFTITKCEDCRRWEFDIENANMRGHWIGIFTSHNNQTEIEFIEEVTPKKIIMKPFVKAYLKKQQERYIEDLKKVLAS